MSCQPEELWCCIVMYGRPNPVPMCMAGMLLFGHGEINSGLSTVMLTQPIFAGHARGKSSSAPAAPLLASAGEQALKGFEPHGVSRSSPDTPLSDRLNRSYTETFSRSGGSRGAQAGTASPGALCGDGHADEASCSASGSLSDRSINLCFASASPGRACRVGPSPLNLLVASGAAAAMQRASLQDPACSAAAAGPTLAFKEPRGAPHDDMHRYCSKNRASECLWSGINMLMCAE